MPYRDDAPSERTLVMRSIGKRFGAVTALAGVDLTIRAGEVHALVGENGAGKSTLMKVLSGAHQPDGGAMTLGGRRFAPRSPLEALREGVAMIYQELTLAEDLTVAQNLVLGRERRRFGVVQQNDTRVRRVLDTLPDLDPDARVCTLGPGAKQLVEIGRALTLDASIVVLDEPTSSLSAEESVRLVEVLEQLQKTGVAVVYITHFLEEVFRLAQRYTVLRDGKTVATGDVAQATIATLVQQMVGRSLDEIYPKVPHERGPAILHFEDLAGIELPLSAGLTLHRGEIVGIAGLVGAGRTELLRVLFALDPVRRGTVVVDGLPAAPTTRARLTQGLGLVSEDRKREGLALDRSVAENLTLSKMSSFSRGGVIDMRARAACTRTWLERLHIKHRAPDQPVRELSGGNQQKVAIARLLHQDADVVLLDEPTRGIDIGSKVEVYRLIGELAAQGKAILMVSSYLPELQGICDRIAVMHRGTLGAARPATQWTEQALLEVATRGVRT